MYTIPNKWYRLKIEVMRTDTDAIDEKVSDIRVDGRSIGGCNPDGEENECTFYDCSSNEKDLGDHLSDTVLRSNSKGEMTFELEYFPIIQLLLTRYDHHAKLALCARLKDY